MTANASSQAHLQGTQSQHTKANLAKELVLFLRFRDTPCFIGHSMRFDTPDKGERTTRVFAIAGLEGETIGFGSLLCRISGLDVIYFAFEHILYISFSIGICFGGGYSEAPAIANTCS